MKLNPQTVKSLIANNVVGRHRDGGKLYLQIAKLGRGSWVFRYRCHGKERWMGLGPADTVSLAEARDEAALLRSAVRAGRDPVEERKNAKRSAVTFAECCQLFLAEHTAELPRWEQSLRDHCSPLAGKLVSAITSDDVLKVLRPLWLKLPVTGRRVQARIARVLDFAKVKGFCEGDNPADWKTKLSHCGLAPASDHVVEHHAAMPWREVPALMTALRAVNDIRARALELVILTGCRSGDVLGQKECADEKPPMRWADVDLDAREWRIPSPKGAKKGEEPFVVPLSEALVTMLRHMRTSRPADEFVFTSSVHVRQSIARKSLRIILKDLAPGMDVHGFRSSFRDWASETRQDDKVAEMVLNHKVPGTKVTRAYERTKLLDARRALMEAWAGFCGNLAGAGAVLAVAA
jgi:integrase